MNTPSKTFIFFGPQGSGKGTQRKILQEKLEQKWNTTSIIGEPGGFFRQMMTQEGYTNDRVKKIQNSGNLQPDFLPTFAVAQNLIENYTGEQILFFDGFPRKDIQATLFHQMVKFYDLKPHVIFIGLSEEESVKRLMLRGRDDDTEEAIKQRLSLYNNETLPLLEEFKSNSDVYTISNIDGDQSVEKVTADIMTALEI